MRLATACRSRSLLVITRTVSSPASVPMISVHPAWSCAAVTAPADRPDPVHAHEQRREHVPEVGTKVAVGRVGVVGAVLLVGELREPQFADVARERRLGHREPLRCERMPEVLLVLDALLPHDPENRRVALSLHPPVLL
jgi:hypothetical protein